MTGEGNHGLAPALTRSLAVVGTDVPDRLDLVETRPDQRLGLLLARKRRTVKSPWQPAVYLLRTIPRVTDLQQSPGTIGSAGFGAHSGKRCSCTESATGAVRTEVRQVRRAA